MVNFNDRPGGYQWGRAKPWSIRNNKYSLLTRHLFPFALLIWYLSKPAAVGVREAVNRMPYWEQRVGTTQRQKVQREKANFDLAVRMTSEPYNILKKYSAF